MPTKGVYVERGYDRPWPRRKYMEESKVHVRAPVETAVPSMRVLSMLQTKIVELHHHPHSSHAHGGHHPRSHCHPHSFHDHHMSSHSGTSLTSSHSHTHSDHDRPFPTHTSSHINLPAGTAIQTVASSPAIFKIPSYPSIPDEGSYEAPIEEWTERDRPMCPCATALIDLVPEAKGIFLCRQKSCVNQLLSLEQDDKTLAIKLTCDNVFPAPEPHEINAHQLLSSDSSSSLNPDAPEFIPSAHKVASFNETAEVC